MIKTNQSILQNSLALNKILMRTYLVLTTVSIIQSIHAFLFLIPQIVKPPHYILIIQKIA